MRGDKRSFSPRLKREGRWLGIALLLFISVFKAYQGSGFEIQGVVSSGEFTVTFDGQTSRYYQVWRGTNLITGDFTLTAIELGVGGEQSWIDPDLAAETPKGKFYYAWEIDASLALDEDEDGMDSFFELQFPFLDPLDSSDGPLDEDGDGVTNLGEYDRNTDPSDPGSLNVTLYGNSTIGDDAFDGLSPVVDGSSGPKQSIQAAVWGLEHQEQRTDAVMLGDEPTAVGKTQPLHCAAQTCIGRLHNDVIVVGHQTIGKC